LFLLLIASHKCLLLLGAISGMAKFAHIFLPQLVQFVLLTAQEILPFILGTNF
jgi:hypothetical protein